MAFNTLRIECVVHSVLSKHDVYNVVADMPFPLQLRTVIE